MSVSARPLNLVSADGRILSAVSAVTLAAIAVKLVAALKEFTVAGVYGRCDEYEAFLTAALVPALLVNLISETMSQALIPTFVRVRDRVGRGGAQQLLSNMLGCTAGLLILISLAAAGTARWFFPLLGSHFGPLKLDLAVRLFYGLLPVILMTGLAANFTAVLNTTGRYGLPALAQIATPMAVVLVVPLLYVHSGIWAMVYATTGGALAHLAWVTVMMKRRGYRPSLRWQGFDRDTREVARQYGPMLLSGAVASGGLLVDQSMAAMLPSGSVATLAYGARFVSVVLAVAGGSVASAVTPVFCEMVARHDWDGCRRSLWRWGWISAAIATLLATLLMSGAHLLVRLTFQHGVFGVHDGAAVSLVLEMYAIQIPFFVCSRVFYRFLIAMRRTDLVLYCGLVNLVLDVVLNLVLMRWMGVAGIALATSLWTISTMGFLSYWAWKVLPQSAGKILPLRAG